MICTITNKHECSPISKQAELVLNRALAGLTTVSHAIADSRIGEVRKDANDGVDAIPEPVAKMELQDEITLDELNEDFEWLAENLANTDLSIFNPTEMKNLSELQ